MTLDRPPNGGLFRLSGPSAAGTEGRGASPGEARSEVASEARDAIRHFVRVLERLDRSIESGSGPAADAARAAVRRTAASRPARAPRSGAGKGDRP